MKSGDVTAYVHRFYIRPASKQLDDRKLIKWAGLLGLRIGITVVVFHSWKRTPVVDMEERLLMLAGEKLN